MICSIKRPVQDNERFSICDTGFIVFLKSTALHALHRFAGKKSENIHYYIYLSLYQYVK